MRSVALALSIIFMTFVAGPTVVKLIDDSVDVSFAFTANEEESSSKNLITFESLIEEIYSNRDSIEYLRIHQAERYSYSEDYHQVFLEVISPPPKNA